MSHWIQTPVKVGWNDCDMQGHVYFVSYLNFLEAGREDLADQIGIDRRDWPLVVTEMNVRYHSPALYRDELIVCTRIEVQSVRCRFYQRILRKHGRELLVESTLTVAFHGERGIRLSRVHELHDLYENFLKQRQGALN
ncbi:acyl-CoA thioesterase [Thermomonospora curvata]|uniref:Thioesterase superfamily protein n=1 Tax=Thermomonospora curvata (strain ATCC 19995 / DSM 43183 / JCM 3096 / KCTC 9072 / NBRC 15933 / NCIMB 10081 / Henssen B9) TaxID=471852 RepID=D1AEK2_THECD|nr:acyl-CoA thioesterase [Thermomonospora curvata]ACY95818.1 thioesterase superfamily protein [Thermomonospora curvata DSM 43183]